MEKIILTWGFKSDGSAEIFELKEGESLPDGWSDHPEPWHHPNTAHLYADWPPPGHAIAGGYQGPDKCPVPQATDAPADPAATHSVHDGSITGVTVPKKRRSRPRKVEIK